MYGAAAYRPSFAVPVRADEQPDEAEVRGLLGQLSVVGDDVEDDRSFVPRHARIRL